MYVGLGIAVSQVFALLMSFLGVILHTFGILCLSAIIMIFVKIVSVYCGLSES